MRPQSSPASGTPSGRSGWARQSISLTCHGMRESSGAHAWAHGWAHAQPKRAPPHACSAAPGLLALQLLQRACRRSPPRTLASSAGRPARGMRHGAAASAAAVCLACPALSSLISPRATSRAPISPRAATRAARARRRAPHLHTQRHGHRAGAVQVGLKVALGTLRNEAHLRAWPRRGARERLVRGSRLRAGMRAPAHTAPLGCGLRGPARCSCGLHGSVRWPPRLTLSPLLVWSRSHGSQPCVVLSGMLPTPKAWSGRG